MLASFDLYRRLIAIRMRSQMQYRGSFLLDTANTLVSSIVGFLSVALVVQRFGGISGWSLWEIGFLYGMVEIAFGLMDMIFSGFDPQNFGRQVRMGAFDQLLLRPVSISLQVLGSEFVLRRLGRVFQGAVILFLAIQNLSIAWTAGRIIYLLLVLTSQVLFFGGLFMIGAALSFWTVEALEVVNIFTYGGNEMMAYPMNIYPNWLVRFFTLIIPAIFMNFYPALYFLNKPDPFGMPVICQFLAPLVGLGVLLAAFAFWRYGVAHYQSTGT